MPEVQLLLDAAGSSSGDPQQLAVKEALVAGAKDDVLRTARQLAAVSALEKHVSPPYLSDLPEQLRRLSAIGAMHLDQSAAAAALAAAVDAMLQRYGEVVGLASDRFVRWEATLAAWEQRIAHLQEVLAASPAPGGAASGGGAADGAAVADGPAAEAAGGNG